MATVVLQANIMESGLEANFMARALSIGKIKPCIQEITCMAISMVKAHLCFRLATTMKGIGQEGSSMAKESFTIEQAK